MAIYLQRKEVILMNNKNYLFQEVLLKNPVLVGTIGLCPVVAISTSLKAALIMSAITIITLIVAQALTSLLLKHLPQWVRLGLYTLVGMIVVIPAMYIADKHSPETMLALGIYFPLLAVNPLVVRNCEREAVDSSFGRSIMTSICAGIGYSAVLIIVGIVREILGAGTIWGKEIKFLNPAAAFLMPAGGFIIIAYLASLLRVYFRDIDPEFADDLIENSRTNIKGSRKAKLQLKGAKYADGSGAEPRAPKQKRTKAPKKPKEKRRPEQEKQPKQKLEVMTLEEAEELRSASLPPVETTVQAELAPLENEEQAEIVAKAAESKPVSDKTSRFEFVTLDLSKEAKSQEEAERFAAAVAANKEQRAQRQKSKRGQTRKVKEEKEGEEE